MQMSEQIFGPGQKPDAGRSPEEQRADWVRALEEERRGYAARGLSDRVKQVDKQLAKFKAAPQGRRGQTRQTADAPEDAE